MSLHDDFDKEQDVSSAAPSTGVSDLHSAFDSEQDVNAPEVYTADRLNKEGYLFDNYQKLTPEEKAKYDAGAKQEATENSAAFGEGLSKGAFLPAEVANKLTPGESFKNLQQKLIAGTEKGIASLVGDDATQDLYSTIPTDELAERNTVQSNAAMAKAPIAAALGQAAGSTPAMLAASAPIATAGKALSAGTSGLANLAIKGATNVAGNAAIGESVGIANSNADTLEQRAKDGLPSAATAALTSLPFEAAGIAASPEGQAALANIGGKVKDMASRAASKSLGLTPAQLAKLDAKGQTEQLGRKLLDEGVVTPFAGAAEKSDKLQSLKSETGQAIGNSTKQLDAKVQAALAQTDNDAVKSQIVRDYLSKRNLAKSLEENTLRPLEVKGDANNLGFQTKELLSKIERTGPRASVQAVDAAADNAAGVASAGEAAPNANIMGQQNSELEQFITNMDKKIANGERIDLSSPESQALVNQIMSKKGTSPVVDEAAEFLSNYGNVAEDAASGSAPVSGDVLSFEALNGMKQDIRQGINYGTESGAVASNKKVFSRELNDELLDRATKTERALNSTTQDGVTQLGQTPISDKLIESNKDYGALSTGAKAAASNAAKRELAKTAIGTGALAGAGYALEGKKGAVKGLALAAAGKFAGAYGKNIQAVGLDKIANVLQTAPARLGQYAPVLQNAAARGTSALAATNFILSQQSPEYREMQNGIDSTEPTPTE